MMLKPLLDEFPSAHVYLAPLTAVIAFLTVTLYVVLGEQVPKCIALQYPEKISLYVAKPMDLFMIGFKTVCMVLNVVCNGILETFKSSCKYSSCCSYYRRFRLTC